MKSSDVRRKYIEFFKARGHVEIPSAPLVPENDSTTLFTSSGMQPLVPYLLGESHPLGKRLVNSQKSFRAGDIEEVGDNRHTTFFEMLGNWSFGDYFKKEQLPWIWEFLTKELHLPKEKLYVSVFEGNKDVPKDEESAGIWKKLGIPDSRLFYYGVDKNWWSRSGEPDKMPAGEPGGLLQEGIHRDFGTVAKFKTRFEEAGAKLFGSGWVWLARTRPDGGTLEVITTSGHDHPMMRDRFPLLLNDVWEHAYYLHYESRRSDYLKAWWSVVDWEEAARRFELCDNSAEELWEAEGGPPLATSHR